MNLRRCGVLLVASLLAVAPEAAGAPPELAMQTVVVANAADPASLDLARHYLQVRAIPRENLIAIPLPTDEIIDWMTFVTTLLEPLQSALLEREWLEGVTMEVRDEAGRRPVAVSSHRIAFLVLCPGVPLRIQQTPEVPPDLPESAPEPLRTHQAAVDSELSLLAHGSARRDGFLPNPLFRRPRPSASERNGVVRVMRLDGPDPRVVRALIDDAVAAEREGLAGSAYVDLGGPHALGDRWLAIAARQLQAAGLNVTVDRSADVMPTVPTGTAAIYLGWYAPQITGAWAVPGFRFARGAIAVHIHSLSAPTLRDDAAGWTAPLLARGATASVGNVAEPYLEYTHRPDILIAALLRGATFGEAAYEAMPVLGWQSLAVGDPLYRPFPVAPADPARR